MVKRLGALLAVFAMLAASMSVGIVGAYHEDDVTVHPFADPRFEARWARTDEPVATGQVARTWIWGPSPYTPGMMEPYAESPGGMRLVQYFDKSRMELNNPNAPGESIWVVTQGLLALDMMRGQVQVGDDAFVDHSEGPSHENVAGDPGPNNGPTYATMGALIEADARAEGTVINQWLALDGTVTVEAGLAAYGVTAAHRVTQDWVDHTVASVFWNFMNSQGVIWDGQQYRTGYLFGDADNMAQPFYAVGLPVTEAYWTTVRVLNTEKDVLVQCFERRCLTYTPSNPAGWQVEAGNVGQHYYRWLQTHDDGVTPPPFDVLATDLLNPRGVHVGPDGTVYIAESGVGGDTCVEIEFLGEIEEVCFGMTGRISAWMDGQFVVIATGLPSLSAAGDSEAVGPQDVYVTADGMIFAIIGLGAPPDLRDQMPAGLGDHFGWLVQINEDGSYTPIADVAAHEDAVNPDGDHIDSNPYSLIVVEDGFVVADAGGNSLLWVSADGMTIETLAVFPVQMALAPPFLGLPGGTEIPMESVPTGVAMGPDGNYYVAELTGFPFQQGAARVWRVTPDGTVTVFADGFTNIIDIAFDNDGNLLVLEIAAVGLLGAEGDPSGRLVHVVAATGVQHTLLHHGLVLPAGVAVGADGTIYITNFAIVPGMSQLIAFTPAHP
jgi:hypothetical protein